jgi:hypothetical protein
LKKNCHLKHVEKLAAIKDLLVLNGRIGLIRPEERQYWGVAIYRRQSESVHALKKWIERPMVVTALLHRWLQMDDGEGASDTVNYAMYAYLAEMSVLWIFPKPATPYSKDQLQGLQNVLKLNENIQTEMLEREPGIQEYIRFIAYG